MQGAYLEEDLGDTTLFEFLSKNRSGANIAPEVVDAYRKTVAVLPRFQVQAGRDLDYSVCYPCGSFDRQSIAWDLNYFKYYFLRLAAIPFSEQALENDFSATDRFLAERATGLFSVPRLSIPQRLVARVASRTSSITRAGAKARCNMTSLRCCSTPRPTCRRTFASNCWTIISIA